MSDVSYFKTLVHFLEITVTKIVLFDWSAVCESFGYQELAPN